MQVRVAVIAVLGAVLSACGGGGGGGGGGAPASGPGTGAATPNFFYSGQTSATSAIGGIFMFSSDTPASPVTVDANALASGGGSNRTSRVSAATVDVATGSLANYHTYAIVFVSGGSFRKQYANQAPGAVQVTNVASITTGPGNGGVQSSANDLCYVTNVPDYANPENTVIIFGTAGTNANCNDGDDSYFWFRLSASNATAPVAFNAHPVAPVYSSSGAIANFLMISPTGALEKRDANFGGTPVQISAGPFGVSLNDKFLWLTHLSASRILLMLPPAGAPSAGGELRIVDTNANTITDARGVVGNRAMWFMSFVNDSNHVYFVSNDAGGLASGIVQRFPVDGSAAATPFHDAGAVQVGSLALTSGRVVFSIGSSSIQSIPKAGGAPTILASAGAGEFIGSQVTSSAGRIFFSRNSATFSAHRAVSILADGTGEIVFGATDGATWTGAHYTNSWNLYINDHVGAESYTLAEYGNGATSLSGANLSVVSQSGSKSGVVLGTVPVGITSLLSFAEGPRGMYFGYDGDNEVFYVDSTVNGSLTRVTDDSVNENPVF